MSFISMFSRKAPAAPKPAAAPSKSKNRIVAGSAAAALAVVLVGGFEGLRTEAYLDIVSVPTVCYGETRGVKIGDRHTVAECDAMLLKGLQDFETGMRKCLVAPDAWHDKTYVSMVSATFNIGIGGFCGSSMAREMNAGNGKAACDALLRWNKAGGREVKGLTKRRQAERKLCLEGIAG